MRIREELRPEQERDQALLQSLVAKMEVRAAKVLSLSCTITFITTGLRRIIFFEC